MARPDGRTASVLRRYGIAVLTVAVATPLMAAWRGVAPAPGAPLAPFLAAILLTGWYAGLGPVIVATLLSLVIYDIVYLLPLHRSVFDLDAPFFRLVWFAVFAGLAAWVSVSRRRLVDAVERARQELEMRVAERTAELRRSEEYLLAAQRLSHTGGLGWTNRPAPGEMYWSEECFRIFGVDPQTTRPSRQQLKQLWHPDDRDRAEQIIDAALRDRRAFEMQVRIVRPDGARRYLRALGQPVVDAAGAMDDYLGAVVDVTERKRAERALRRAREQGLRARFAATLEERTRLGRELHDTLLQGLTGLGLKLVAVVNRLDGPSDVVTALRDVVATTQRTLEEARRAVWDIRSPALSHGGFAAVLQAAAEDAVRGTGVALECVIQGALPALYPDLEAVVVRVAQEAIANIVQHAAARTIRLTFACGARRLRLSVTDDGCGFDVDPTFRAYAGHWGLLGMRERATQIGGTLSVRSSPGHGTRIELVAPCAGPPAPTPGTPEA